MMKNVTKTNNKTALLAILAVFAMIAAGAAVVMASEEADAAWGTSTQTGIEAVALADNTNLDDAEKMAKKYYYTGNTHTNGVTISAGTVSIYMDGTTASILKINGANNGKVTIFVTSVAKEGGATEVTYYTDYSFTVCVNNGESLTVTNATAGGVPSITTDDLTNVVTLNKAVFNSGAVYAVVMDKEITLEGDGQAVTVFAGCLEEITVTNDVAAVGGDDIIVLSNVAAPVGYTTVTYGAADPAVAVAAGGNQSLTITQGQATHAASVASLNFNGFTNVELSSTTAPVLYASTYTKTEADALYAYGTVNGTITAAESVGMTLVGATGQLSYTYLSTTYRSAFTAATAAFTGGKTISTTVSAGTLELVSGSFEAGALEIGGTLVIDKDARLTVSGAQTGAGSIKVAGTLAGSAANKDVSTANFYASSDAQFTNITVSSANKYDLATSTYTIGGVLQADTVVTDATLSSDLTIPEGMTLTVNGMLFMGTFDITVNGTLKVGVSGYIGSQNANAGDIVVSATGVIDNSGSIGRNYAVKVVDSATAASFVSLQGVNGLKFSKYYDDEFNSYMAVSGTAVATTSNVPGVTTSVFTMNYAVVDDDLVAASGVVFAPVGAVVSKDAAVTISSGATLGNSVDSAIILDDGASVTVNGKFYGSIYAATYEDANVNADPEIVYTILASLDNSNAAISAGETVTGFTIYVDKVNYATAAASKVSQRAYLTGPLSVTDGTTAKKLGISGDGASSCIFVPETGFAIGQYTSLYYGTNGKILAQGLITGITAAPGNTIGAYYTVTSTATGTVKYMSGFEEAFAEIASADSKTITLYGYDGAAIKDGSTKYTISDDLEIETGWSIAYNTAAYLVIGSDAEVTVMSGASLNNQAISSIDGALTVMNGGSCSPNTSQYQVVSTDILGDKTYASLAVVLADAEAGDEIVLVGASEDNKTITIPAGVILKLSSILSANTVNVSEGAKIIVNSTGTLSILSNEAKKIGGALNVSGEVDATAGTLLMADTASYHATATSTGTFVYTGGQKDYMATENVVLVGAEYQSQGKNILTTAAAAAESGALAITISDDYRTTDTITLAEGATLTVAGGNNVSVGAIDISAKDARLDVDGTLTGTIIGISGTEGADDVEMYVSDFTGDLKVTSAMSAKGVTTYKFETNGAITSGSIYLSEGTLTMDEQVYGAVGANQTFVVGADATLYVGAWTADETFKQYGSVVINGKVTTSTDAPVDVKFIVPTVINGDVTVGKLTITNDIEIYGTVTMLKAGSVFNDGAAGKTLTLDGTITVPEDTLFTLTAGTVIVGSPDVGAESVIGGKISIAAGAYVLSYDAIDAELINGNAWKETVFCVNLVPYMYTYVNSAGVQTVQNALNAATWNLPGLNIAAIKDDANWYKADGTSLDGAALKDNDYAGFAAAVQQVTIKTSWAAGTSLYIDNIRMVGTQYTLDIGKHTVKAVLDPGYKGTMTITFDGVVVPVTATGSYIELDSLDNGAILAITGDISIEEQPIPEQKEKDDTMMIILLAILVIMIAILVVVVILRMMRS